MTYAGARGKWGDYSPHIHDTTGQRHMRAMEDKENRQKAIAATINELNSSAALVLVPVPGSGTFAVPRDVYDRLLEIGASQ